MKDVAAGLTTRVQITTDGHNAYLEAVEGAFGADVDFALLIKLYGSPAVTETRYGPGVFDAEVHPLDQCFLASATLPKLGKACSSARNRLLQKSRPGKFGTTVRRT
jgi:hypothetical protein